MLCCVFVMCLITWLFVTVACLWLLFDCYVMLGLWCLLIVELWCLLVWEAVLLYCDFAC